LVYCTKKSGNPAANLNDKPAVDLQPDLFAKVKRLDPELQHEISPESEKASKHFFFGGGGQRPFVPPSPQPSSALHFSDYSFWVHHTVNPDDWHLLTHAMASDFSFAWQFLSKITIGFWLRIKLHALKNLQLLCFFSNTHNDNA
jgi:hypothetical protein